MWHLVGFPSLLLLERIVHLCIDRLSVQLQLLIARNAIFELQPKTIYLVYSFE